MRGKVTDENSMDRIVTKGVIGMKEIKCPYDLNQFLLGEPIFENPFPEEECKQRKFYGDCYHCFSTAIASRDHQLKASVTDNIMRNIESEDKE